MLFSELSFYLSRLEQTSSRNEITVILADLFKKLDADEIKMTSYLLIGTVAPSYEGIVFNVADKMVERAVSQTYEVTLNTVLSLHKTLGDLGQVSYQLATKKDISNTTIREAFDDLVTITQESGDGSVDKRISIISSLLQKLDSYSAKYVTRIILGNLRLGFSDKTIIDALSVMESGGKEYSKTIARAYEVVPDIGTLAKTIKEKGIEVACTLVSPIIGIPVLPMLCARIKSPSEMVKKMGEVSVEPKFDGLRVLIHYSKPKKILKAFTRNLKDISNMFPELSKVGEFVNADEFILDAEAVGMDPELLTMADFQTTMKRRRKHDISESQKSIPLTFQVFDCLYADKNLMDIPYKERRIVMKSMIKENMLFKIDDYTFTTDPEVIKELHKKYRSIGLEGIIVKKVMSTYVPGRTGWNWVKMKEEESAVGKLSDTIDGVIIGYTLGQGKRVSFGIGQFLVGVKDGEIIKTLTKVGTGLTDDQFKELSRRLKPITTEDKPLEYDVHKDLTPDYWVSPEVVVELAGDDLTESPKHSAGYALRFPRLVKFRDDKNVKTISTVSELKKLFVLQKS